MNRSESIMRRRDLLSTAATVGAATACAVSVIGSHRVLGSEPDQTPGDQASLPKIIDTNVSLFQWPFRRLPLDHTDALVKKLRELGITEAWAGSFEGVFHRDIRGVNERLVSACKEHSELIPIGSVNPELPGWEDDLNRCIEQHQMPGVRLHPNYHQYTLADPRFDALVKRCASAGRFIQIAVAMEDTRMQHPMLQVPNVDLQPLPKLMHSHRNAKVQILNDRPRGALLETLATTPGVCFDTARVDGTDAIATLLRGVLHGRLMFGSHAPFLIPEAALIRAHESDLDQNELRSLMGSTAQSMNTVATRFGLPSSETLKGYRIWDSYFTPSHSHPGPDGSSRLIADVERTLPTIEKGHLEKLCYFAHVGIGTTTDAELEKTLRSNPNVVSKPLDRWPDKLLGMIQLNANDVPASLDALNRWLRDGPMLGVYFPGGGPGAMTCTHRNFDPLVQRVAELNGVIMQHTWFKTGGKQGDGESTPTELAELARRFPEQKFVCAHAGGEWERGIRAVMDAPNVLVETSGFDATAGFIEMAVRDLGAERIIFGSHLPSRSLGTELGKIIAANVSQRDKKLMLGQNYRNLLHPILQSKRL